MKNPNLYLLFFAYFFPFIVSAQDFEWKAGLYNFFDNTEFANSDYQIDQTMAGVRFSPTVGLQVDSVHHLFVGIDALKEYGSRNFQDGYTPTAYYFYDGKPFRFFMGSFSRAGLLDDLPKAFFQDSIYFYRPNITGLLWQYRNKGLDAKAFLDWTGRITVTDHEAFFMGGDILYRKNKFFSQFQTYMNHYAGTYSSSGVRDNGILHAAVGLDLTAITSMDTLSFRLGYLGGIERWRAVASSFVVRNGFLGEVQAGYKNIGMKSTIYFGEGLMAYYYSGLGNALYWGDPFYRGKFYDRTDVYYDFFKLSFISGRLMFSQHFSENRLFVEQSLIFRIALDQNTKKSEHKTFYGKE